MSARFAFAVLFPLLAIGLLTNVGCDTAAPTDSATEVDESFDSTPDVEITIPTPESNRDSAFVVDEDSSEDTSNAVGGEISLGDPAPTSTELNASDEEATLEKADVGAGKKGRGYGGGIISEPASQYFAIRERTVFQIQIPQALKMYKAEHDKLPKDHEDFMSKIVKENNITLPELPDGKSYVFDAEKGELMIQTGESE